ncbi:DUF7344 domain-containing protein [Halorarius halobius]|uniref:DUF7344 domain-containing protein n=1 Tax=Halorarius halobius TaxID=2962671 RepID=UPI0020CBD708|nr:hypothetical protein [Halorarius halobius]
MSHDGEDTPPDDSDVGDRSRPGEFAPPDIDPAVLELDHVFSVLGHPRRRYLMYALAENPEWTLEDLATKLTAWEQDLDETRVSEYRRDQTYVSLYHTHVPKLVDEGVVEFDSETETIRRGPNDKQVFAVLAGAGHGLDHAQEQHASRSYDSTDET